MFLPLLGERAGVRAVVLSCPNLRIHTDAAPEAKAPASWRAHNLRTVCDWDVIKSAENRMTRLPVGTIITGMVGLMLTRRSRTRTRRQIQRRQPSPRWSPSGEEGSKHCSNRQRAPLSLSIPGEARGGPAKCPEAWRKKKPRLPIELKERRLRRKMPFHRR